MLYCGVSELDITPPLGSSMPGYFHDRRSTGIIDRLFVKALVMEADGERTALAVLDTILVTADLVKRIRERVGQFTDLLPSQVMVSATHTHTGPPVATTTFMEADENYLSWLATKSADAIILAYRNRQEARIGVGIGYEGDIAFNRRYFMKDGTVRTNPGIGNLDVDRPAGPIDPQVSVVRIDDSNGRPLGVISSYALHTDTVKGTKYCADYPGELSTVLKRALGEEVVSIFMMGTSGDINHNNVLGIRKEDFVGDPLQYLKFGRILGGEVLKVREKIKTSAEAPIRSLNALVSLQYRQPTEEQVREAKAAMVQLPVGHVERAFAQELLKANECGPGTTDAEIQVIRIGDTALVGMPGELFVELGLALKAESPFGQTLINTLCNGIPGTYICTRQAYEQGGYEPRITWGNRLQTETGDLFVAQALKLLREIHVTKEPLQNNHSD